MAVRVHVPVSTCNTNGNIGIAYSISGKTTSIHMLGYWCCGVSFVPCYTILCWLMLCFCALLTWTAPVFLGNWRVKLWSDPTYHTSFFRYDVTLKESTHTDHIYGLHAPYMPHQGYRSNITQLSYFLILGCRGPISTMPHAYIYKYMFIHRNTLPRLGFDHAPKAYCTITSLYHSN